MKKSDLTGWQKVCAFTIAQNYKSKGTVIGLVLICTFILLAGPLLSLAGGSKIEEVVEDLGSCKIENFYVLNDTDIPFDEKKFAEENMQYEKVNFVTSVTDEESILGKMENGATKDIFMHIHGKQKAEGEDKEKYRIALFRSKDSEISSMEMETLSDSVRDFFFESRLEKSGMTEDQISMMDSDIYTKTIDAKDISEDKDDDFDAVTMSAVIFYSMIVMMIVLVSSQKIAVSLVTEKSSKVIETLLLTVRPLAIITGKIVGTMVVLILNAAIMLFCGMVSGIITTAITAKKFSSVVTEGLINIQNSGDGVEIDAEAVSSLNFDPVRIIAGIGIIIITTVLAFVFYSIISGITGASCSSMDDLSNASSFIALSSVAGVYLAMGSAMANNPVLTEVSYLFPFSGIYTVPVHFMFGKAGFSDVLILWAELILLTVFLFRFAAKIYHVLVYHNGERLKLKNLLEISKSQKGTV
ncbi:MAG: ABC transporter permease [Oscillospiraceae bacterium]|nr:ABC transporter permease [Oscillospiraceae bacterium]MBR3534625.1 ABC transporter permease [Oscillospiraceae bacterium]MBR6836119.1 ABC transporter permease [Oscillospiraceae bacterium]